MELGLQPRSAVVCRRSAVEFDIEEARVERESARRLRELSHDLRQPLAAISALAEAAASVVVATPSAPDAVLCCLEQISDESRQLLLLCRHVLDQLISFEPVPVHVVANEIVERSRAATQCRLEVDATPCVLRTDPIELRRVLVNLVENAQRAAGAGGTVEVAVRVAPGEVWIEVGDSGAGFGAAPAGSSGLGLVVLERFARRHGGRVEIGTSHLGGARVTCVIPTDHEGAVDLELRSEDVA
jgi:signal transduction histidine kinase